MHEHPSRPDGLEVAFAVQGGREAGAFVEEPREVGGGLEAGLRAFGRRESTLSVSV